MEIEVPTEQVVFKGTDGTVLVEMELLELYYRMNDASVDAKNILEKEGIPFSIEAISDKASEVLKAKYDMNLSSAHFRYLWLKVKEAVEEQKKS